MFENLRHKRNQKAIMKQLKEFHDVELYEHQIECKMVDGSMVYVGDKYAYTKKDINNWIEMLFCNDSLHTNTNTYIKTRNIVECKKVDTKVINTKYRYDDYYDFKYKNYFQKEDIEKCKKEYNKLVCLSNIK